MILTKIGCLPPLSIHNQKASDEQVCADCWMYLRFIARETKLFTDVLVADATNYRYI